MNNNQNPTRWNHPVLPEPTSFMPGIESDATPIGAKPTRKELLQWKSDLIYFNESPISPSAILALIEDALQSAPHKV